MTNLPKIFCLTLKDTPKRREYAEQHFKQHDLDVTFFEGINGKKFGLKTTIPYKENNHDGDGYFMTSGHVGCILSHYMLWTTISYLPYDEYLIFEDDVILCDGFKEKLLDYKSQLPNDWQYVFVGHCCLPPENYQIKVIKNIITTTHPPMCTHAYMIKKSSIPILLDTNHCAWAHIDIQIQKRSLKQLKHYVLIPPLAEQMSINHDIKGDFSSLTLDWEHYYKNQQV